MKNTIKFALVGALLAVATPVASAADCYKVSKQASKQITAKPENVLAIVSKQISANKGCACEIVKAAIVATEADKKQVAQIVEQAIAIVPNKTSLLTTCALAVAPDAHVEVMAVAAKYAKNTGATTGDSAKGGAKGGVAGKKDGGRIFNGTSPLAGILKLIANGVTINFTIPGANGGGGGQITPNNPYSE